jgi:hypothetical protein
MEDKVAALALGEEGCGDQEYCYGNVSIELGATAAEGDVHCHQQTGRASWLIWGVGGKTLLGSNYILILIPSYVGRFMQPIIYTNNGWGG